MRNSKPRYFGKLNYSLANEDTRVEFELLPERCKRVLAVCGSGARAVPLLARNPEHIDVVDISPDQLRLGELRITAVRTLEYEEFLHLMGYPCAYGPSARWDLFSKLKLSEETKQFWIARRSSWEPTGFLALGSWERHFVRLGDILRLVCRIDATPIFDAQSLEEQLAAYRKRWKPARFRLFLKLAFGRVAFNRFLYRERSKRNEANPTPLPLWKMIEQNMARLFTTTEVRKNFFLQLMFLGGIRYPEGVPLEASEPIFKQAKQSMTRVEYRCAKLQDHLRRQSYSFCSLSDTLSYLEEPDAREILSGIPEPTDGASARIVIRTFRRHPKVHETGCWQLNNSLSSWAKSLDCTGVYDFQVFDYCSSHTNAGLR
jgi:S-adenosylmethionine-diacylglycerol 3-amino-3-carboxypropyl transferase